MRRIGIFGSIIFLLAAPCSYADLTLRYRTDAKLGALPLPPQALETVKQQVAAHTLPQSVTRIKGDRVYCTVDPLIMITDLGRDQITLLDPRTKQFATFPASQSGNPA